MHNEIKKIIYFNKLIIIRRFLTILKIKKKFIRYKSESI